MIETDANAACEAQRKATIGEGLLHNLIADHVNRSTALALRKIAAEAVKGGEEGAIGRIGKEEGRLTETCEVAEHGDEGLGGVVDQHIEAGHEIETAIERFEISDLAMDLGAKAGVCGGGGGSVGHLGRDVGGGDLVATASNFERKEARAAPSIKRLGLRWGRGQFFKPC